MTQLKRRATYQYGTLVPEPRRRGPDIWVYRFFENRKGKRVRRKTVVGTLDKLPTRAAAERACENLRLAANAEVDESTPTMCGIIDRYIQEVLKPCLDVPLGGVQEETALMSFQTAGSYRSVLNKYVSPRWESYKVTEFQRPQVRAAIEQWLASLAAICPKFGGSGSQDGTAHFHNDEVGIQVRCEVGLLGTESHG
jgi:integrase